MTSSFRAGLEQATARLAEAGVPDPRVDAELLAGFVTGRSRGGVQALVVLDGPWDDLERDRFAALVERRAAREPLQHLTGRAPFRSLELAVGPGVFVPRPETETLAGLAIDALRACGRPEPVAVDLGTGSGALALALATEVPHARVHAVERSREAHAWARRNIRETGARVELVLGDFADAFAALDGHVDVVVSNPPYVPSEAVPRDPEVRLHDPAEALYGGEDGLDPIRVLSRTGLRLLRPGGLLALEHGELQGAGARGILAADGWAAPATYPDLTARDRVTTARR